MFRSQQSNKYLPSHTQNVTQDEKQLRIVYAWQSVVKCALTSQTRRSQFEYSSWSLCAVWLVSGVIGPSALSKETYQRAWMGPGEIGPSGASAPEHVGVEFRSRRDTVITQGTRLRVSVYCRCLLSFWSSAGLRIKRRRNLKRELKLREKKG